MLVETNVKYFRILFFVKYSGHDASASPAKFSSTYSGNSRTEVVNEIMKTGVYKKGVLEQTTHYYPPHSIIKMEITDVEKDTEWTDTST